MENESKEKAVILFAEDDEQIRWITTEMLTAAGYRVLTAENGELAFNLGLRHLKEIDILLTDLRMPKIRGKDLIELMLTERPDVKVLISSGYIKNKDQKIEIMDRQIPFLIKPYSRKALREAIEKL